MAALCSILLLISAFLLFSIQPMVAKMLLPILGGSPSVWNTAMVFYQAALLGGYFYAHLVAKKLAFKNQLILHAIVLILPMIVLPLGYGDLHPPAGQNPIPWMLLTMALSVGLPFFVLSASSPLIQSWFSRSGNQDPYFLYAASNVGSFLGLLAYPFVIEPKLAVAQQSGIWTYGYIALVVLFLVTAIKLRPKIDSNREQEANAPPDEPLPWSRRLKWVFLAFVPSSQFIGVTTYLTTDIAVMPLLWVIPLAIYLLTMVLVFAKRPPIPHKLIVAIFPYALAALVFITAIPKVNDENNPLYVFTANRTGAFGVHLLMLFIGAMLCHGELAKDRPTPGRLTEFFLWMSFGGVLGGMFNALVAPSIFVQVVEYMLILAVSGLALPARVKGWTFSLTALDIAVPIIIGASTMLMIWGMNEYGLMSRATFVPLLTGVGCLAAIVCAARPLRFALAIGGIILVGVGNHQTDRKTIYSGRSFFGVHRVEQIGSPETGFTHSFMNGRILHGKQVFKPGMELMPLTYYHPEGPLGDLFNERPRESGSKIGVVGLGVGTTAAYAKPGEDWVFYEIDPLVEELARDPKLFTYLSKAQSPPKVLLGDARLRLHEAEDNSYDILTIDAFSSDSIPAHLMTVEAFQLYFQKLKPNGVLAVHISNKFLELEPLAAAIAEKLNIQGLVCHESNEGAQGFMGEGRSIANWCIFTASSQGLWPFIQTERWKPLKRQAGIEAWTDEYSSLLPLLRLKE